MYDKLGLQRHLPLQNSDPSCVGAKNIIAITSSTHVTLAVTCPCWINLASTLYQCTPNMPRDKANLKAMAKKAAHVAKDDPTLKVPEVASLCTSQEDGTAGILPTQVLLKRRINVDDNKYSI